VGLTEKLCEGNKKWEIGNPNTNWPMGNRMVVWPMTSRYLEWSRSWSQYIRSNITKTDEDAILATNYQIVCCEAVAVRLAIQPSDSLASCL